MGEAIGDDAALGLALQLVVADRRRRGHRLIDVAIVDHPAAALPVGAVGPDAGETIGLQLGPHRKCVAIALAHALAHLLHLARDAEQVLHMMSDLVGDDVSLRELAWRAKTRRKLVEEAEVEIDPLVGWTVERSHGGLADAAVGPRGVAEKHQLRLAIDAAYIAEDIGPDGLGALQHARHELHFRIGRGPLGRSAGGDGRHIGRGRAAAGHATQDFARVGAEQQRQDDEADDPQPAREQAAATAAHRDRNTGAAEAAAQPATTEAAAIVAPILDVAALIAVHLHGKPPPARMGEAACVRPSLPYIAWQ